MNISETLYDRQMELLSSGEMGLCEGHPLSSVNSKVTCAGSIMIETVLQGYQDGLLKENLPQGWMHQLFANWLGEYMLNYQLTVIVPTFRKWSRYPQGLTRVLQNLVQKEQGGMAIEICHKCLHGTDNSQPACSRHSHLFVGTKYTNRNDHGLHAALRSAQSPSDIETVNRLSHAAGGASDLAVPETNQNTDRRAGDIHPGLLDGMEEEEEEGLVLAGGGGGD